MAKFELQSDFQATGDQPDAIAKLVEGLQRGDKHQFGASREFNVRVAISLLIIVCEGKSEANQSGYDGGDMAERLAVNKFAHAPSLPIARSD